MALPTIAAVEAGGTKFVISVTRGDRLGKSITVSTSDPETTLASVIVAIKRELRGGSLDAVGIASFGPINVDTTSTSCGRIGATPKLGWSGINCGSIFRALLAAQLVLSQM